jgi:hypothetical protein
MSVQCALCDLQIRNLRDPGPVIYSFSERPALRDAVDYSETHDDVVESMFHKVMLYSCLSHALLEKKGE